MANEPSAAAMDRAEQLLRDQLAKHPDEGVRTMALVFGPSVESIRRVALAIDAKTQMPSTTTYHRTQGTSHDQ